MLISNNHFGSKWFYQITTLDGNVYIHFVPQLGSFTAPMSWFINLTVVTCNI